MESFQEQCTQSDIIPKGRLYILAVEFGEDGKEVFTLQLPPILFLFGNMCSEKPKLIFFSTERKRRCPALVFENADPFLLSHRIRRRSL